MKIKVELELDIPEEMLLQDSAETKRDHAIQLVFDHLTNYAVVGHLQSAIKYLSQSNENPLYVEIAEHNKKWSRIIGRADNTLQVTVIE